MATELDDRTPAADQAKPKDSEPTGLRSPSLEDQQAYQNRPDARKGRAQSVEGVIDSASGKEALIIKPVFSRSAGEKTSNTFANDMDAENEHENHGIGEKKNSADADDPEADYNYDDYDDDYDDDANDTEKQTEIGQQSDENDAAEQQETIDGKIPLSPEALKAKEAFIKTLTNRLQDDPRFRNRPEELAALESTLEDKLAKMDQRVLHEQVDAKKGCDKSLLKNGKIDQQQQLALAYNSLSTIANEAGNLTFDNSNEKVFNEPWMVNNILVGGIMRGAHPELYENQGKNNTCASTSSDRTMSALMIGQEFKTAADMCTKGKFETVDNAGQPFTCAVDKESLRPDLQASQLNLQRADMRDAYGQISDLRIAQLNLDLKSRDFERAHGRERGEGRYLYKDVTLQNQSRGINIKGDSGERVIDRADNNKVIANSPCLDGTAVSRTKQALFGRYIGPNFGKETTIVSGEAFGVFDRVTHQRLGDLPDVTTVRSGSELLAHLKSVEAKGWRLPTLATHVGNYVGNDGGFGGTKGGWHATSIQSNKLGGIDFINNWGGEHDRTNMSADELYSWMKAPEGGRYPASDRWPSDHIFDPDGVLVKDGINPLDRDVDKLSQNDSKDKDKDKDKLAQDEAKKKEDKDREKSLTEARQKEELQRQIEATKMQLAEIENKIAGLPENDPVRNALLSQKLLYENSLRKEILT